MRRSVGLSPPLPSPLTPLPPSTPTGPGRTERLSGSAGQRFVSHARPAKNNVPVTLLHHIQESAHLLHTGSCARAPSVVLFLKGTASTQSHSEAFLSWCNKWPRGVQVLPLLPWNFAAVFLGRLARVRLIVPQPQQASACAYLWWRGWWWCLWWWWGGCV